MFVIALRNGVAATQQPSAPGKNTFLMCVTVSCALVINPFYIDPEKTWVCKTIPQQCVSVILAYMQCCYMWSLLTYFGAQVHSCQLQGYVPLWQSFHKIIPPLRGQLIINYYQTASQCCLGDKNGIHPRKIHPTAVPKGTTFGNST